MKKILVLVMVFMMVGCQDENGDVTNFQRIMTQNEEILEWIKEIEDRTEDIQYIETVLDRLDTIERKMLSELVSIESEYDWIEDELELLRQSTTIYLETYMRDFAKKTLEEGLKKSIA